MKKFANWFFGVPELVEDAAYGNFGYSYRVRRKTTSPCDILRSFVERLVRVFDPVTVALVVLKILGYFSGGWVIVFIPSIMVAVLGLIDGFLDRKQSRLLDQAAEAQRKKDQELWEKERQLANEEEEEEDGDIL